jgi:methylmalonyl-CoA epimerase
MLERIDHVGIVVADLGRRLKEFTSALGMEEVKPVPVPSRGVQVARLPVGEAAIELIQPVDEKTRVAAFLREHGEGLDHLAFRVLDLSLAAARLKEKGILSPASAGRVGAFGRMVIELPPEAFAGVRIQLVM